MWHQRKLPCDYCQQLLLFSTLSSGSGTEGGLWGKKKKNGWSDCSGENWHLKLRDILWWHISFFPKSQQWEVGSIKYYRLHFSSVQEKHRDRLEEVAPDHSLLNAETNPAESSWSHTNIPETTLVHPFVTCTGTYLSPQKPLFVPLMDSHIIRDMCLPCLFFSFTELFNVFRLILLIFYGFSLFVRSHQHHFQQH